MSRIDKTFVAQYQKAYADGKISDVEAGKLAKAADGNKGREEFLRDHLRQDAFEGPRGRQAVEKAVGGDQRLASGFVGVTLGKAANGADIKGTRELGDPKGYVLPQDALAVASASGKNAAVALGKDGRWHPLEVDSKGASLAHAAPSLPDAKLQSAATLFVPAPSPSRVTPASRDGFQVELKPAAANEKAAAQAIFGKDQVPEGYSMRKAGTGWEVVMTSRTDQKYPNDIPWAKYQADVKPEVQQLLFQSADPKFNVPRPGTQPKVQPDPDAADKEKAKQVNTTGWTRGTTLAETISGMRSIDVTVYDTTTTKKMTQKEAVELFFDGKSLPKACGLDPLPEGSKGPWNQWRVMVPDLGYTPAQIDTEGKGMGMNLSMRARLNETAAPAERTRPDWVGPKTAAALENKQLPPKGLAVSHPKEGIAVWKEGKSTFWMNEKTGQVEGFNPDKGDGIGTKIWNNWNQKYIESGMSPADAAVATVKDMESTNKQMLMAFAQTMAANRAPGEGIAELVVKGVDVTGKLGMHDRPTGTDDMWAQARQHEEEKEAARKAAAH